MHMFSKPNPIHHEQISNFIQNWMMDLCGFETNTIWKMLLQLQNFPCVFVSIFHKFLLHHISVTSISSTATHINHNREIYGPTISPLNLDFMVVVSMDEYQSRFDEHSLNVECCVCHFYAHRSRKALDSIPLLSVFCGMSGPSELDEVECCQGNEMLAN